MDLSVQLKSKDKSGKLKLVKQPEIKRTETVKNSLYPDNNVYYRELIPNRLQRSINISPMSKDHFLITSLQHSRGT